MEFRNFTPLSTLAFEALDQLDQAFHVVVMRCTLTLDPAGPAERALGLTHVARLAEDQTPLAVTDEYHGMLNRSSVRYESDLSPFKPRCDVLVNADAWAPGGRPSARFNVGLQVETPSAPERPLLSKSLSVTGPREWRGGWTGWSLSAPEEVERVLLRYEHAYGGECRVDSDDPAADRVPRTTRMVPLDEARARLAAGGRPEPVGWDYCSENPVGSGFVEKWWLEAVKPDHIRAPQIELPDQPLSELGVPYPVLGLGPIAKGWRPRRNFAGTYDDRWIAERHPYLPSDFAFEYWNSAPGDQQIPWLEGDEVIALYNLCPQAMPGTRSDHAGNTLVRFALPGHEPHLLVRHEGGEMQPWPARIDTLYIDFGMRDGAPPRIVTVHRASVPVDPPVRVLEARMLLADERRAAKEKERAIREALLLRDARS